MWEAQERQYAACVQNVGRPGKQIQLVFVELAETVDCFRKY